MERGYYNDFILVVGTRKDIEEIAKIICEENAQKVIADLPEGKYVSLEIHGRMAINAKEIKEKFPSCDLLIYYADGNGYNYVRSHAGSKEMFEDKYYMDYNGDLLSYSGLNRLIFEGQKYTASIVINLTNGRKIYHTPKSDTENILDSLLSQPLTLGLISDACNPYVAPKKKREFIDSLMSEIPDMAMISSIEYERSLETAFSEFFIERIAKKEFAKKFSDITVLRFLDSYFVEKRRKIFDYTTNTATNIETYSVFALEDPASGKYDVVETECEKNIEEVGKLAGFVGSDYIDIQYELTEENSYICTKCLTDAEIIKVPDEIDGLPVTDIGDGCFEKLTKVKKIILPRTIKSIGKGVFAGCKKLDSVVYADNPDSKDDFVICNKGKLVALFTKQTSYIVPDYISEIGKNAFSSCLKLKEVTLRPGMKKLVKDSLAECKTLKKINLSGNTDNINIAALEKGGIKEVILPSGEKISILDKYMFGCFVHTSNGMEFSYQAAAEKLSSVVTESTKFKIAIDYIENHLHEIDCAAATDVLKFAIKHTIGNGDTEMLSELLETELVSEIDLNDMVQLANRCGNLEIAAMILNKSCQSEGNKKIVIRHETPAEPLSGWSKLYVKVRFENNKAYSYFCSFNVKEGDKVFVQGKMAGMPGEIIEIVKDSPTGRAAMYTLNVTSAFNVTLEEADDAFEL